jgi:hypothetical protein
MGRNTGEEGNYKAAEYVAAEFRRLGLQPAGDSATFFQTIPFRRASIEESGTSLTVGGTALALGEDYYPLSALVAWKPIRGARAIYGGLVSEPASWPSEADVAGKVVVLTFAEGSRARAGRSFLRQAALRPPLSSAAALAIVQLDRLGPGGVAPYREGETTLDPKPLAVPAPLMISPRVAFLLFGAAPSTLKPGALGTTMDATITSTIRALPFAARNVVAILPGRDATTSQTYVALTAHNDHVGFTNTPVDHDSLRAFNRVVRPQGADSPPREATADEWTRIRTILDSLRRVRPPRRDSIYNGADDDGSGTVTLLEIAERLTGSGSTRPRRSILFVSHAAEEAGLVGSRWFTEHSTVPIDSIIAEFDMDMVGRGGAVDVDGGGPAYLEMVGWRRNSEEFGDVIERVNARQAMPFKFSLEYDKPGHPGQYYCRADHYSYARYNIPSASISRGLHVDYHQLTDEPQYIDYDALARVATFVGGAAVELANMDHRPRTDRPKGDPTAPCRQ